MAATKNRPGGNAGMERTMTKKSMWIWLYLAALDHAAADGRTLFSSRIDGCLLPW